MKRNEERHFAHCQVQCSEGCIKSSFLRGESGVNENKKVKGTYKG